MLYPQCYVIGGEVAITSAGTVTMYVNGRLQNIDELLARMEAVRGRLDEDAQAAKQSVQHLSDWRNAVRKNPCVSVALVAAAGFLSSAEEATSRRHLRSQIWNSLHARTRLSLPGSLLPRRDW